MTPQGLEMLINHGEDDKTERKRELELGTRAGKAELIRDMLSLVNAHGDRTAYLLVGIDNQGQKHDISHRGLDDAHLQQIVDSLVDPPMRFSFHAITLDGVTLGIIEIPPSRDRPHLVKRRYQENSVILLDEGETWIRHGSSKRRPTAWNYKLLKEDYAQALVLQPHIEVVFANASTEVDLAADWTDSSRQKRLRILSMEQVCNPYPPGTAPLCFRVSNTGSAEAKNVQIFIDVPEGCVVPPESYTVFRVPPDRQRKDYLVQVPERNQIVVRCSDLTHGLSWQSPYGWVTFPEPGTSYELRWTAHAGNMARPTTGTLRIKLLGLGVRPTETFPGDSWE